MNFASPLGLRYIEVPLYTEVKWVKEIKEGHLISYYLVLLYSINVFSEMAITLIKLPVVLF